MSLEQAAWTYIVMAFLKIHVFELLPKIGGGFKENIGVIWGYIGSRV